jgi:microcystin-dependent protein
MAYPPFLARITHFTFDANAGLESPSPTGVDSEFDALHEVVNQQNSRLRAITTVDGRLKNVGAALAMALAGHDEITATAAQTDFVTDIDWNSGMSVGSTLVFVGNTWTVPDSVQDDGSGFLEVTLAAQDVGTVVTIYAFSGTTTAVAEDVTIADAGGYTLLTNVEDAIQEIYSFLVGASGKTYLEGILVKADYVLKAGSAMDGGAHLTFSGGGTVKGLPAAAANGEAVRYEQFLALQSSLSGLTSTFMPKSGGTWTGALNFNSQVTTGVPTPTTTDAIASKGYVDTVLASFGGLPVATMVDFAASSPPTGWLLCDGAAISRTTYASLFAVIGVAHGVGDGSTTFNVPDMRGRASIGTGTGAGLTTRALGDSGGEETHVLTIPEMPAHTHALNPITTDSGGAITVAEDSGTGAGETATTGGGAAHNTMMPFRAVTKIIKY